MLHRCSGYLAIVIVGITGFVWEQVNVAAAITMLIILVLLCVRLKASHRLAAFLENRCQRKASKL